MQQQQLLFRKVYMPPDGAWNVFLLHNGKRRGNESFITKRKVLYEMVMSFWEE